MHKHTLIIVTIALLATAMPALADSCASSCATPCDQATKVVVVELTDCLPTDCSPRGGFSLYPWPFGGAKNSCQTIAADCAALAELCKSNDGEAIKIICKIGDGKANSSACKTGDGEVIQVICKTGGHAHKDHDCKPETSCCAPKAGSCTPKAHDCAPKTKKGN
jgi:hypothetical protein